MATTAPMSSAFAQTKMVLKASTSIRWVIDRRAASGMGKKLEAATDGGWRSDVPSMQLGGEKEMIDAGAARRAADRPYFGRRRRPGRGHVNVFNMPFVFRNSKHMEKVIDGEIGDELLAKISANERPADRAVLDERRLAQRLQQQAAHPDHCRSQGPQGPHDGQPAVLDT